MPLIADSDKSLAAASLIRAAICDDADTGVLIMRQNGGYAGTDESTELSELTLAVTSLAVRVLLFANGYNVGKTMKVRTSAHVLTATSHFGIHRQDAGGPDAADLMDLAATYLKVHARLAGARPLAERALAITAAAYGSDHPTAAALRANLSLIAINRDQSVGEDPAD